MGALAWCLLSRLQPKAHRVTVAGSALMYEGKSLSCGMNHYALALLLACCFEEDLLKVNGSLPASIAGQAPDRALFLSGSLQCPFLDAVATCQDLVDQNNPSQGTHPPQIAQDPPQLLHSHKSLLNLILIRSNEQSLTPALTSCSMHTVFCD